MAAWPGPVLMALLLVVLSPGLVASTNLPPPFSSLVDRSGVAQESCSLGLAEMEIVYGDCEPRTVLVPTCLGRCHSYVQVDPNQPSQLQRHCRCCRDVSHRGARVRLRCPHPNDPYSVVFRVVRLNLPRECECRPCSG